MNSEKLKLYCWADAPTASTGFGVVTKNVLRELYKTGKFDINILAVNYYGDKYDPKEFPYQIVPAKLLEPNDPFGSKMFLRAVEREDYDIIWILNDIFVVEGVVTHLKKILEQKRIQNKKIPKIIYYYPVDCTVLPECVGMIELADATVCITEFGKKETLAALKEKRQIDVIHHGCDRTVFRPIDKKLRQAWRQKYLGIANPNTFLFINVNRNSVRKDIARCIYSFAKFRLLHPDSKIYIHCAPKDMTINLFAAVKAVGLTINDIVFPANFNLAEGGLDEESLVNFYGCADAYITTTLGEGWGLTITEAMACGLPVIAPNNTSLPEIIGSDRDRGYLYECRDIAWVDNSGYRKMGRVEDIVGKMEEVYKARGSLSQHAVINRAYSFINSHSWEAISKQWLTIFERIVNQKPQERIVATEV